MIQGILPGRFLRYFLSFDKISAAEFRFVKISPSSKVLFFIFYIFLLSLFLTIFPHACNFPFLQVFLCFLDFAVLFLLCFFHFSFSAWHIFNVKFLYPNFIFLFIRVCTSFLLLGKYLHIIHIHKKIKHFLFFKYGFSCTILKYII